MKLHPLVMSLVLCTSLLLAPLTVAQAAAPAPSAETQESLNKAADAYAAKDFATAKKLLTPLAEANEPFASYALGVMAAKGEGGAKNLQEAEKWWTKSANAGNPQAQFNLAGLYASGEIGKQDTTKARQWLAKSVNNKNWPATGQPDPMLSEAAFRLGSYMLFGEGGPADEQGALKHLRKSADSGHPGGQFFLGMMYKEGKGVKKDLKQARQWLNKAAAAGVEPAKEALASMGGDNKKGNASKGKQNASKGKQNANKGKGKPAAKQ